jgi:Protein of unknown function (DUF 659)
VCASQATALKPCLAIGKTTGFTLTSDGWSSTTNRPLLNILTVTPMGSAFVKAVDTSGHVKDAAYIAELICSSIEDVGVENVVQVVTDNAAVCAAAGRIVEERYVRESGLIKSHCKVRPIMIAPAPKLQPQIKFLRGMSLYSPPISSACTVCHQVTTPKCCSPTQAVHTSIQGACVRLYMQCTHQPQVCLSPLRSHALSAFKFQLQVAAQLYRQCTHMSVPCAPFAPACTVSHQVSASGCCSTVQAMHTCVSPMCAFCASMHCQPSSVSPWFLFHLLMQCTHVTVPWHHTLAHAVHVNK